MRIWMVTTKDDHDSASIPFDFVEAPDAEDALILLSSSFSEMDWPHLEACELHSFGAELMEYAKLNRLYKDEKKPWDAAICEAHTAALNEWYDSLTE